MVKDKKKKSNKDNDKKKNLIILVVMVVVLLGIVGVITYAYLANSVDSRGSADIDVTTNVNNSDLLVIEAGEAVNIVANTENFPKNGNDLTGVIYSSVALQTASSNVRTYKYDMFLSVPVNEFGYTSGACYTKTTQNDYTDYNSCTNEHNDYYAMTSDSNGEYKCFNASGSEYVNNSIYNSNPTLCTSNSTYMWVMNQIPEITADIFKATSDNQYACTLIGAGKCIKNKTREIVSKDMDACTTDTNLTWIANVYENGICYALDKSYDITTVKTSGDEKYPIYVVNESLGTDNETISTDSSKAVINNYRTVVTLHNLDHNQIENGNKSFNGYLKFEVTTTP